MTAIRKKHCVLRMTTVSRCRPSPLISFSVVKAYPSEKGYLVIASVIEGQLLSLACNDKV
jgi:hypothetical protein